MSKTGINYTKKINSFMLFNSDLESDDSMLDIYGAGLCTFIARSITVLSQTLIEIIFHNTLTSYFSYLRAE